MDEVPKDANKVEESSSNIGLILAIVGSALLIIVVIGAVIFWFKYWKKKLKSTPESATKDLDN